MAYENMLVGLIQDRMYEVEAAAKWCACRGLEGRQGDRLPNLLSVRAANWIDANPRAFREMVRRAS